MSIKSFALAGAAIIALTAGATVAQADEQDEQVRQLNIQQLEKAQSESGDTTTTTAPAPAPKPDADGQGGPELQGPPTPDEGMTDDEPADEPATDDDGGDEPQADEPADQPEPESN